MILQKELGKSETQQLRKLVEYFHQNKLRFAGNKRLKIYGTLNCKSGKRLQADNRVFFESEQDAIECGFRPCGHCMRNEYKIWKAQVNDLQI